MKSMSENVLTLAFSFVYLSKTYLYMEQFNDVPIIDQTSCILLSPRLEAKADNDVEIFKKHDWLVLKFIVLKSPNWDSTKISVNWRDPNKLIHHSSNSRALVIFEIKPRDNIIQAVTLFNPNG